MFWPTAVRNLSQAVDKVQQEREVNVDRITVTVRGELAGAKRLALAELARLATGIQGGLERVALVLRGQRTSPGRRPRDVIDDTRLDLVAYEGGSATLVLERHGPAQLFAGTLDEAVAALIGGIVEIGRLPTMLPHGWDPGVIAGVHDLMLGIGGGIDSIEIEVADGDRVVLDKTTKAAVKEARRHAEPDWRTVRVAGRLHMGDFAPTAYCCRIDTPDWSVMCDFEGELRPTVLDFMDRIVVADGLAELHPAGSRIRLLHIDKIEAVPEQASRSLDELIAEQGVRPITNHEQLRGEPIDDFDEFLAAIQSLRDR